LPGKKRVLALTVRIRMYFEPPQGRAGDTRARPDPLSGQLAQDSLQLLAAEAGDIVDTGHAR
jgi:hypothetical protein